MLTKSIVKKGRKRRKNKQDSLPEREPEGAGYGKNKHPQ
jgi:hypothetical protein